MAAGHVDRTALDSNYQNVGDVYLDTKTEGAMEVLAQQIDDNYDAANTTNTGLTTHKTASVLDHPDSSVTTQKIANSAVSTEKVANLAITREKIANGAVGASQLATGLSTTADTQAQFNKRGIDVTTSPYSAKGDGVTDDTAAISSAIDAANTNGGGVVFFPEGTYLADISVTYDNIHIVGAGKGVTIIKKTSSTADTEAINITGNNCSIRSLTVQGQSVASYVSNERGIYVEGTDDTSRVENIVIEDVEVTDIGAYGILTLYGENVYVERCYVHDVGYAGIGFLSTNNGNASRNYVDTITPGTSSNAYGIYFSNTPSSERCVGCSAYFNKVKNIPIWEGLDTHGGLRIKFIGNEVENCKYGINFAVDDTPTYSPDYGMAIGNTIDIGTVSSPGRAIGAGGAVGLYAIGIIVSNNIIKGYGLGTDLEGAIMFRYTEGLRIDNNVIKDSIGGAITAYTENTNISITNNTIDGLTAGTAGNSAGIRVRSANNSGYIGENVIDSTAEIGIVLNTSSPNMEFGHNRIVTTNTTKILSGANAGSGLELYDTETKDPVSLADGAGTTLSFFIAGAKFGDTIEVAAPYDLQGITVTGYVSAVNTVSVRLQNKTGGTIDLASGDWKIRLKRI